MDGVSEGENEDDEASTEEDLTTGTSGPIRSLGSHGAPYFIQKGPMGPWGPLLLPSRGPRAPYFYPEGAHGAPFSLNIFFPGKKISQLCCEKKFPLHGRIRGPMGPPTFTQPGTQGPLLLPRRGPWGPLLAKHVFPRKKKSQLCCKVFFPLHGRILAICFLH